MLHRSTSSRRRRASRSAASSPAQNARPSGTRSAATSPGRRASIAVSPIDGNRAGALIPPEMNRSPRHSIIPDIALMESREDRMGNLNFDVEGCSRSPRHSLVPDCALSPRNSLLPDSQRSPRHSLIPNDLRSPRNSLIPDSALSPRNSLIPDQYNRSPRNSLVPDQNRTPRHSLTHESNAYGSRLNITEYNRSPRNSLLPDGSRTPRQVLTPTEPSTWNLEEVNINRSPRHSIIPDTNRSPRGSITPEVLSHRTSPRGSISGEYGLEQRSPRGSIGFENGCDPNRSPRGSIAPRTNLATDVRSSRGSLTLTFQEPPVSERRASADNPSSSRGRNSSPSYRRSSRGNINAAGYGGNSGFESSGSRRASSSVSQVGLPQVSGDEQRRLCADQKYSDDDRHGLGLGLSLTTYGSVAYQLKDANLEATGTCDFVCKALRIVNKTVVVTILLVCLSVLPLIMLIMGVQFLRDCPREPNIPIYMVVGGSVGCVKMGLTLWNQLHTRHMDASSMNATSIGSKVASVALTLLLITWFGLGNYWILRIKWPDYAPSLFEPNKWCHRTLYVFALVQLCIVYTLVGVVILLVIVLAFCQIFGCPWLGPARYK